MEQIKQTQETTFNKITNRHETANVVMLCGLLATIVLYMMFSPRIIMISQFALICLMFWVNKSVISLKYSMIAVVGVLTSVIASVLNPGWGSVLTYATSLLCILVFKSIGLARSNLRKLLFAVGIVIAFLGLTATKDGAYYNLMIGRTLNPNMMGFYYFTMTVCFISWAMMSLSKKVRRLVVVFFILGAYCIYKTDARTSLLALALYGFALLIKKAKFIQDGKRFAWLILFGWILVLIIPIIYIWLYKKFGDQGLFILGKDFFSGRESVWMDAFDMIMDSPILGSGNEQMFAGTFGSAHNSLLAIWKTCGIIPVLVYVVLFVFCKSIRQNKHKTVDALKVALIGYLFIAAFEASYTDGSMFIFGLLPLLNNIHFSAKEKGLFCNKG